MKVLSHILRRALVPCIALLLSWASYAAATEQGELRHFFLMKSAQPTSMISGQPTPTPSTEVAQPLAVQPDYPSLWGQSTSTQEVPYHRGPVLQSSRIYAIYWGDQTAFPTDLYAGMDDFFAGFGSSTYANILDEYLPAPAVSQFYGSDVVDNSTVPTRALSRGKVAKEICSYIKSGDLPLDPIDKKNNDGGVYFLFTSTFPTNRVNYCAWHSHASCEGKPIAIAYIPNVSSTTLCDPGDMYQTSTYTYGTRLYGTVVAHELAEAITDPKLNAWHDRHGSEVGDKCAWEFQSPVTLTNNVAWQLQEEWSDLGNTCMQEQSTP